MHCLILIHIYPEEVLFCLILSCTVNMNLSGQDSMMCDLLYFQYFIFLLQMSSLSVVFGDRATRPYSKALKAKAVTIEASAQSYKGKNGLEKSVLTCALSDGEKVVKAACYDPSKFSKLKVRRLFSSVSLQRNVLCSTYILMSPLCQPICIVCDIVYI